jgi:hypothetical protein
VHLRHGVTLLKLGNVTCCAPGSAAYKRSHGDLRSGVRSSRRANATLGNVGFAGVAVTKLLGLRDVPLSLRPSPLLLRALEFFIDVLRLASLDVRLWSRLSVCSDLRFLFRNQPLVPRASDPGRIVVCTWQQKQRHLETEARRQIEKKPCMAARYAGWHIGCTFRSRCPCVSRT